MSLADVIAAEAAESRRGPECTVHKAMGEMSKDDLAAFVAAIDNSDLPGTVLARAVKRYGIGLTAETIQRHRRGACGCAAR